MSMDLTGITNKNEYYTNHYFSTVFEENAGDTITVWNVAARESEEIRTPWSNLRRNATQFYAAHDRFLRSSVNMQTLQNIRDLADSYLKSLGYPEASPQVLQVDDTLQVPVYLEMKKVNGAPLLWVVLMASTETDAGIMESYAFDTAPVSEDAYGTVYKGILGEMAGEALATKILFDQSEPPRFLMYIGMNQIALIDRNKWNEKRYLQFEMEEIFSRLENTTLQAMSILLHKDSLCPEDGKILLDELDEQNQRNASGVSQDLKYALRESIELLGNEVLYDMKTRLGRDLEADPVDAGQLTLECLRYMYRMLFVLFIESRPELGYAPIKAQSYYTGYSLESLRDIADNIRDEVTEVGDGYYLHETLAKLYDLIYAGYPKTEEELKEATGTDSLHDMFLIAPLKAHIFDPEYTKMITASKLRNSCMLKIIELMSLTKSTGRKNSRRGRISYANLGINQMGAVYEALLSYRGFIAEQDLYEVKRAGDSFNELDVGYFVPESELSQYTEDERVRYESGEKKGKLRMYEKGSFIYRLAGREREKSASYYTPEVLTKCLVKYALKELLEGKTADDILQLTICEPAMGSAAFLNEAINQLAEAYVSKKEQETGEIIGYEDRFNEIQKVPDTCKVMLDTQYRMPAVIGTAISKLFYDGKLKNGNGTDNKKPILFESNLTYVNFDKERGYCEEKSESKQITNRIESKAAVSLVSNIRKRDSSCSIAIITPYKGQKRLISNLFIRAGIHYQLDKIFVDTIDSYQGSEADVVIFCTTRAVQPTLFFKDTRRLNVALSRAKRELIILGRMSYFYKFRKAESCLPALADYIKENGYVVPARDCQFLSTTTTNLSTSRLMVTTDNITLPSAFYMEDIKAAEIQEKIREFYTHGDFIDPLVVKRTDNGFLLVNTFEQFKAIVELGLTECLCEVT